MSYLNELLAFDTWLDTHELSTSAIVLWYALMQIDNKTGWKERFNVPNSLLSVKTGGLSVPAIHRAREALRKEGLIEYYTRTGGRATEYKLLPFCVPLQNVKATDQRTDQRTDQATDQRTDQRGDHIPRQDKIRQDKTTTTTSSAGSDDFAQVVQAYSRNIHPVYGEYEAQGLQEIFDTYGKDQCLEAFKIASQKNARNLRFIEGVLKNLDKGTQQSSASDTAAMMHFWGEDEDET